MEGRGVTNYSANQPSHTRTTKTTEFDDALLKRHIVTLEQVYLAKGASPEEAHRLAQEKKNQEQQESNTTAIPAVSADKNGDDDDDSFQDDMDDEFFSRYRQERMAQLEENSNSKSNNSDCVQHISRNDWSSMVNESSHFKWVLITLVNTASSRHQEILQELHMLQRKHGTKISALTIEATDAIPNWPIEKVPALFAYKDGIKQKEWISNQQGEFPTSQHLERLLQLWGVLS